jgi:hypothetical protein
MHLFARIPLACAALLALALSTGCQSISDSVTSPSRWVADSSTASGDSSEASADSSNAASRSVSGSSSPEDETPAESSYRNDVRVAARAWATDGGSSEDFAREIARISERHGISDWQGQAASYRGVAEGLREAGLPEAQVDARLEALGAGGPTPTL